MSNKNHPKPEALPWHLMMSKAFLLDLLMYKTTTPTNTLVMSQMCGWEIGINYQDKPGICEERAKHTILHKTRNKIFSGPLPANYSLLAGTLLANEFLFVGTKCLKVHLSVTLKVK